jgi:hypothetical protein
VSLTPWGREAVERVRRLETAETNRAGGGGGSWAVDQKNKPTTQQGTDRKLQNQRKERRKENREWRGEVKAKAHPPSLSAHVEGGEF